MASMEIDSGSDKEMPLTVPLAFMRSLLVLLRVHIIKRKKKLESPKHNEDASPKKTEVKKVARMLRSRTKPPSGIVKMDDSKLNESVETLTGLHIFVCSHSSRDKRCGYCGPILIKRFKEKAELWGLENVSVTACSHIGGHKYAGNLIIYSFRDTKVSGHWYGYITSNDVPELLDNYIGKGEIIDRIIRGQLVMKTGVDLTLPNGNSLRFNELDSEASTPKEEIENGGGCCQGVNGFSCCRDATPELENETSKLIYLINIDEKGSKGMRVLGIDKQMGDLYYLDGNQGLGLFCAVFVESMPVCSVCLFLPSAKVQERISYFQCPNVSLEAFADATGQKWVISCKSIAGRLVRVHTGERRERRARGTAFAKVIITKHLC
ncbi:sucrase/ferredoxin-like family protein [Artemisia annua]|uniref:Sucrase/ferredoxin-like family protein n=1 Tax=Artemisia annua TaxID=35608 RepID=A0A2U1NYQ2_ARTAN|nr:sucrase/ferredoxin-like family protein [Artemisia annua]